MQKAEREGRARGIHGARSLPAPAESYRDYAWRRDPERRVETAADAERMIEDLGFCFAMTDCRRPGPSLYIAVCGRRDAHMPRNVQKDPEASLAWLIKDEVMRSGQVFYAKLLKGRSTFVAKALVPSFFTIFGVRRRDESKRLSEGARRVLRVLRREWELATTDLKKATGIADRAVLGRALDELQLAMKVVPSDAIYSPAFSYVWTLADARFARELAATMERDAALRDIAKAYLQNAGMTLRAELSKVTGLSRADAGRGNHALVREGFARRLAPGVYCVNDSNFPFEFGCDDGEDSAA